ncbi:hypothetical protein Sfulv_61880 [Streptomyces fulvorobeus]|uniref:Uncharacterized protein n=1 Tax=Streptomyces fulvorobeus TaxID=284028 RepID=A0A7J0CGH6_9ACTN|nr:hypothetical protein [Streptomyces fulvorobeus]GFN01378.1 hypothetical protein Sfulv_61880 [Streptomyces fulvorobeus]
MEALQQRLESLDKLPASSSKRQLTKDLREAVAAEAEHRVTAAKERADAARGAAAHQAESARQDIQTREYLGHRQLVLAEAFVFQMRGIFRLARRRTFFGALLLLAGASLYASVLPAGEDKPKPPGTTQESPAPIEGPDSAHSLHE